MKNLSLFIIILLLSLFKINAQQINYAEYFFDTDPGISKAINLGLNTNADTINYSTNISTKGLSAGFHVLYVRIRSSDSLWSMPDCRLLFISDTNKIANNYQTNSSSLKKGEYFFDNEPGTGNATPVLFQYQSDTVNLVQNIPCADLSVGFHTFYFRIQDSIGKWSIADSRLLYVDDTTKYVPSMNIRQMPRLASVRYQFDTISNPAFNLQISPDDTLNVISYINTSGLSQGLHKILISIIDSLGHVSFMESLAFTICNTLPNSPTPNGGTSYFVYNGGSTSFSATAPTGTTIFWRGPNGFNSTNSTINLSNINSSKLGNYLAYAVKGNTKCDTSFALVINVSLAPVPLNLKVFPEGLYLGNNTLVTALFNADGISSTNLSDSISIELRDTIIPFSTLYTQIGTLSINGLVNVNYPNNVIGHSYYIVVIHRNTIETWSSVPVLLNFINNSYDFTNAANKAYGDNLKENNGVFLMYSGDINQDGAVDFNDYPMLDIGSRNGELGYLSTDLNGDASVDFNDYPIIDMNSSNGIISITP